MPLKLIFVICIAKYYIVYGTAQSSARYIGVGYNLITGNPDGGEWAKLGQDPGLLLTRNILKTSTSHGSHIKDVLYPGCSKLSTVSIFYDAKSYQDHLLHYIKLKDDNSTLEPYAFTRNQLYRDIKQKTLFKHDVFRDNITSCVAENTRYFLPVNTEDTNYITAEFAKDVCKLSGTYDPVSYKAFLDTWGTHVTVEVELGQKSVSRSRISVSDLAALILTSQIQSGTKAATLVEELYEGYGSVVYLNMSGLHHADYVRISAGQHLATYDIGSQANLAPIGWTMIPISDVITNEYWQNPGEFINMGICVGGISENVATWKRNIERALADYPSGLYAAMPKHITVKFPITWPSGTYGLIRPKSGCPRDPIGFVGGWVKQDSEDNNNHNHWTTGIHIFTTRLDMSYIIRYYCMKTHPTNNDYVRDWPQGNYCIQKKGVCPAGFQAGYIYMDDQDWSNGNSHGGSLPDGDYGRNTKINYCCRQDGHHQTPILMPIDKPFYLLRYTSACQEVIGMNVTDEYIYFDNEDVITQGSCGGAHPYDALGCNSDNAELHFCYYHREDHKPLDLTADIVG